MEILFKMSFETGYHEYQAGLELTLYPSALTSFSVAVTHCDQNTLGRKGFIGLTQSITVGSKDRAGGRIPKAGLLALPCGITSPQGAPSQPRKYSRIHVMLLAGWLPHQTMLTWLHCTTQAHPPRDSGSGVGLRSGQGPHIN